MSVADGLPAQQFFFSELFNFSIRLAGGPSVTDTLWNFCPITFTTLGTLIEDAGSAHLLQAVPLRLPLHCSKFFCPAEVIQKRKKLVFQTFSDPKSVTNVSQSKFQSPRNIRFTKKFFYEWLGLGVKLKSWPQQWPMQSLTLSVRYHHKL